MVYCYNLISSDMMCRNIHHPSSVSLFGAVDDSEKCGYVMEYCHNGNLYLF